MGVVVSNTNAETFGVLTAETVVTHIRHRLASDDSAPIVRALSSSLTVPAGRQLRLPAGNLKVKYNSGDLTDAHMTDVAEAYWSGVEFEVDAMTSNSVVVSDSGYSQQTVDDWTFTTETDDA